MKTKISKSKNHSANNSNHQNTVEVLYQKMGDRWFAFSMIEDEVFVGSIPVSEVLGEDKGSNQNSRSEGASNYRSAREMRRDRFTGNS